MTVKRYLQLIFVLSLLAPFGLSWQSVSVLIIQSAPGGTQVYVDDEPRGTTSQEGRLKISTLKPGKHLLRLSLSGYENWQGDILLKQGQPLTQSITLSQKAAAGNPQTVEPSLDETLTFIEQTVAGLSWVEENETTHYVHEFRQTVRRNGNCAIERTTLLRTTTPKSESSDISLTKIGSICQRLIQAVRRSRLRTVPINYSSPPEINSQDLQLAPTQ
jgi:hypothetical protein